MTRSIIAGCKFSVALTRALLKEEMQRVQDVHAGKASLATYVDDIPITATGTAREVHDGLLEAITSFSKAAKSLRLVISPKSALVTSRPPLTRRLVKDLAKRGVKLTPSTLSLIHI